MGRVRPQVSSWRHHANFCSARNVHFQLLGRQHFDAAMGGPGALLEDQPAPLRLRFITHAQFPVQGIEQLTVVVGAVGHRNRGHQHADKQQQHKEAAARKGLGEKLAHRNFSATRMTALRERGLALSSASEANCALPWILIFGTKASKRTGKLRGRLSDSPLTRRRMNSLTMRSSREWKLITTRRPPTSKASSAASRPASRSPNSLLT